METIKLSIVPVPKPRMTQSDRWRSRPCTERYWRYKDELKILWGDRELPDTYWAIFTVPMPKSWSKKKCLEMDGKPHKVKADADNLGKGFQDALWNDDSGIWDVRFTKYWGTEGSIEIKQLGD